MGIFTDALTTAAAKEPAGSLCCGGQPGLRRRVDQRMGRPGERVGGGDEQKRGVVDVGTAEGLNGMRVLGATL